MFVNGVCCCFCCCCVCTLFPDWPLSLHRSERLSALRRALASRGTPADYVLPASADKDATAAAYRAAAGVDAQLHEYDGVKHANSHAQYSCVRSFVRCLVSLLSSFMATRAAVSLIRSISCSSQLCVGTALVGSPGHRQAVAVRGRAGHACSCLGLVPTRWIRTGHSQCVGCLGCHRCCCRWGLHSHQHSSHSSCRDSCCPCRCSSRRYGRHCCCCCCRRAIKRHGRDLQPVSTLFRPHFIRPQRNVMGLVDVGGCVGPLALHFPPSIRLRFAFLCVFLLSFLHPPVHHRSSCFLHCCAVRARSSQSIMCC